MTEQTFNLPDLGEGLTEAEVVRWLVGEGDLVTVDQVVVEVETAKSLVDVPTPYAGRVTRLYGAEGASVDVGSPLITVASLEQRTSAPAVPRTPPDPTPAVAAVAAETYREEEAAGSGNVLIGYGTPGTPGGHRRRRPKTAVVPSHPVAASNDAPPTPHTLAPRTVPRVTSPLVRRLARDTGVDLIDLAHRSGNVLITRSMVQSAASALVSTPRDLPAPESAAPTPPPTDTGVLRIPMSNVRKTVSAALSRSRSEIPEATVWVDVDATPLLQVRQAARSGGKDGPGLLAYLARFTVAALRRYPVLNSRLDTDRNEIEQLATINLGFAVQGDRGLVVPAVSDAGMMTTSQLNQEIRGLTARAREGRATPTELSSGTFTVNNYGAFRVDGSAAIINHPQVAILGFGRFLDRPWVVDGEITVRTITQMSLVFDHRICDGGTAAGFMRAIADAIEDPTAALAHL